MRLTCVACALLLASLSAHAGVYTYLDAEGNRVFTDQPRRANAERLELAPPADAPAPPPVAPEAPLPAYLLLRIGLPEPAAVIRSASGGLLVSLESEPGLQGDHHYRLLLDGQPLGEPSRSPVFALDGLAHGDHQLAAEIVDGAGRIVERTPSQPLRLEEAPAP
ncbi:DUF4124 domain-containing protein [Pseudomonas sp. GCM10022188]|uniref:DUF4124 domain-containing protein n=1 Tax=Pseudomonas TaxID=286 RepID=UPI001E51E423|nr:DUF4124 domain-containing protein [Pseudomonas oryzagri]MCC6076308.1 DUF4124 domain-containing protein [Pseudomonas oryzagri]